LARPAKLDPLTGIMHRMHLPVARKYGGSVGRRSRLSWLLCRAEPQAGAKAQLVEARLMVGVGRAKKLS